MLIDSTMSSLWRLECILRFYFSFSNTFEQETKFAKVEYILVVLVASN